MVRVIAVKRAWEVVSHCSRARSCAVASHLKRKSLLDDTRVQLSTKRAALDAAVAHVNSTVTELEDAVLAARNELALPKVATDIPTILTVSQRFGYVVSAPHNWQASDRGYQCAPVLV